MDLKLTKWSLNRPTSSVSRPSIIYPNWYFWFENKPSGNPVLDCKAIPKKENFDN
jgi:hypothetical protein